MLILVFYLGDLDNYEDSLRLLAFTVVKLVVFTSSFDNY
jgi:hypothetical protein